MRKGTVEIILFFFFSVDGIPENEWHPVQISDAIYVFRYCTLPRQALGPSSLGGHGGFGILVYTGVRCNPPPFPLPGGLKARVFYNEMDF